MPWSERSIPKRVVNAEETQRIIGYTKAINEALSCALARDPNVLILGQGVDDPHASFGVTRELSQRFGTNRIIDVPLSEEAIMGICVGAALSGMRPINFHNRPDFLLLAMNQIVTHAAKFSYLDNGQSRVPLVVWAATGRGWGSGPQHSQAIQGMLLGIPGLKIVMPSTPFDAKGLMLSAIADNNPVFIFEHRWLMKSEGPVPEDAYLIPFGKGVHRRTGSDVTIVGVSHAIALATEAADAVSSQISCDVIDLRTIRPLDEQIILSSVEKTGRVLIVDSGWETGGVSAEIGCLVAEKGFQSLRAPVRRLGFPDCPTPAGYSLERLFYPDRESIIREIKQLVNLPSRSRL